MTAFDFQAWIAENAASLCPPVGNKALFPGAEMTVMVVGGPNARTDFHDDPVEEFFHQLKGDMVLKLHRAGGFEDVVIREGEVYLLPPHVRHSPQRPMAGSVGLVVESPRPPGALDGFEWFCFGCGNLLHRVETRIEDIVADLPPLFAAFHADLEARSCEGCGALHPGERPPEGWVTLPVPK